LLVLQLTAKAIAKVKLSQSNAFTFIIIYCNNNSSFILIMMI